MAGGAPGDPESQRVRDTKEGHPFPHCGTDRARGESETKTPAQRSQEGKNEGRGGGQQLSRRGHPAQRAGEYLQGVVGGHPGPFHYRGWRAVQQLQRVLHCGKKSKGQSPR